MKTFQSVLTLSTLAASIALTGCGKGGDDVKASAEKTEAEVPAASSAQPAPAATVSAPSATVDDSGRKLVRIATIKGAEKNSEFQRNISLLQRQKQLIIALNKKLEAESNAAARDDIQTKIDAALAKLNENNQKMYQAYGFTLSRNYVYTIEKSSIHMAVSEAEAENVLAKTR